MIPSTLSASVRPARTGLALAVLLALAACGGSDDGAGASAPTQVVAKVNDKELSIHQVNFFVQRLGAIPPERAPQVRKQVLDSLVEQEVLVQQAVSQKLDRDPQVLAQLEATRREVLSRAFLERTAASVEKPSPAEVAEFYRQNPTLFDQRRIYRFNQIVLPGRPANWPEIQKQLEPVKSLADAQAVLRAKGIDLPVSANVVLPTEQLPMNVVPQLAKLKGGEVVVYPAAPRIVIAQIVDVREAPVAEDKAGPVIEQFLLNRKRQETVQAEVKRLKEGAKVVYEGEFADAGKAAASASATPTAPAAAAAATPAAAPAETGAAPAPAAVASPTDSLEKGLKGLR